MMDFLHPLALLLLPPLAAAVYVVGRARLLRLPWLRALATLVLRLSICALLVVALAGPAVTRAATDVHVVLVLDRSASIGAAGLSAEDAWLRVALAGKRAGDSLSVVSFGGTATWSGPVGAGLPALPAVDVRGTDIAAALRLALSSLPSGQPSRIVLLSDGRQTQGDALQVAEQAAAARVPISVVQVGSRSADVALTAADLPRYTRSGDHVTLRIAVQSASVSAARIQITLDGVTLGERAVALHVGTNSFLFAQTIGAPGTHVYEVRVLAPGDATPENDQLSAVTVTGPAPRVLLLERTAAEAAPLAATLRAGGLQVREWPAERAPNTVNELSGYDAVVLADVPAAALTSDAVAAIGAAVHDRGRGLLVTGGPHSFAVGGYPSSGLEGLLPVTSLSIARTGRGQVGMILIIDKSGSMMDEVHNVSKISMAQAAALDAAAHLRPSDEYGIIAFDDSTRVVVPFGPVGTRAQQARTRAAVTGLEAFGNTQIYPALRQAARYLFESHASFKHVVLMTDGQGETAPFTRLIQQMRQNGITLSTIGIGTDAELDELRGWADTGGGRFYYAADPHDIPRLVVLETRISSGPTRVQGVIGVRQSVDAPALRSLVGRQLPVLHAYNIAAPRETAQVVLQSQLGDPLLAQWQVGLGRVAAWTGGSTEDWSRSWLRQTAFWSDTVRGVMAAPAPELLRPDLQAVGGTLHVGLGAFAPAGGYANLLATRATVEGPDGRSATIDLVQDAPGHYVADLPARQSGAYRVTFAQYDGSALLRQAQGALAIPYSAEYAPGVPDRPLLDAIAAAGNAPVLRDPGAAFSSAGLPAYPARREVWPLLALLALLLFPIDVAVRLLYTPSVPRDLGRFSRPGGARID